MRFILGLMTTSVLVVGTSVLAWHGLELNRDLALHDESGSAPEEVSTVEIPVMPEHRPTPQPKVQKNETRGAMVASPSTGVRVMPPLPTETGGISVPLNARAGAGAPRSASGVSATRSTPQQRSSSGRVYGLERRTDLTRSLDYRWYSKPNFSFTSESRKRNSTASRTVRSTKR